jgi:hypothetical protein
LLINPVGTLFEKTVASRITRIAPTMAAVGVGTNRAVRAP